MEAPVRALDAHDINYCVIPSPTLETDIANSMQGGGNENFPPAFVHEVLPVKGKKPD